MKTIEADFPRGKCPVHTFGPLEDRAAPIVLFFPDAFGPRPESYAVAEELAEEGWRVFMIDQFYEHIPYEPIVARQFFDPDAPRSDGLMKMFGSVTQAKIDEDVGAMIALASEHSDAGVPFAATGYCMGGRFVLTAACASERVVFAACFHAGHIAPAEGDGAIRRLSSAKGRIYIGVASKDQSFGPEEQGRLAEALLAAEVDHVIESYHGKLHGWVFPDLPVYDAAAAAKHMRRLKENCAELFAR